MGRQAYHGLTMEMLSKSLGKTLNENIGELRRLETEGRDPTPSKLYAPNGKREVARRMRQIERKASAAAS